MTSPLAQSSLLTPLISSAAMRAILDDRARLQRMLDFEIALARMGRCCIPSSQEERQPPHQQRGANGEQHRVRVSAMVQQVAQRTQSYDASRVHEVGIRQLGRNNA